MAGASPRAGYDCDSSRQPPHIKASSRTGTKCLPPRGPIDSIRSRTLTALLFSAHPMPAPKEYLPWTPREENSLEDWLHEHAHLTWAEKAQYYPKPRTVDGLRSKRRALRNGERRHSRILRVGRHGRRSPPPRRREPPGERPRGRDESRPVVPPRARSVTLDRPSEDGGDRSPSPVTRDRRPLLGSPSPPGTTAPTAPVRIEPFRPQRLTPPTRMAAMIRIGQSIIQLPLRLLA